VIVLDASAAVDHVLRRDAFERIAARLEAPGENIHAPHLIDLEVAGVLRRLVLQRAASVARARAGLHDFAALAIARYPATALLERIWELRANLTVFDAAYIALAEALEAPLVTTDARLARAPGHRAEVELVE
jgi:predicted nucleic acid-binding protein